MSKIIPKEKLIRNFSAFVYTRCMVSHKKRKKFLQQQLQLRKHQLCTNIIAIVAAQGKNNQSFRPTQNPIERYLVHIERCSGVEWSSVGSARLASQLNNLSLYVYRYCTAYEVILATIRTKAAIDSQSTCRIVKITTYYTFHGMVGIAWLT